MSKKGDTHQLIANVGIELRKEIKINIDLRVIYMMARDKVL